MLASNKPIFKECLLYLFLLNQILLWKKFSKMSEEDRQDLICKIEISPHRTYLVATICNQDHKIQKIVRWYVKDMKEGNCINKHEQKNFE